MAKDVARYCVVGAGGGGLATAAHLALMGHRVILCNRSPEPLEALLPHRTLTVEGVLQGRARLAAVTTDPAAVAEASVVIVTTPSSAHEAVAARLAPYLTARHAVLLHPGRTLGAAAFVRRLRELGGEVGVVGETDTLLYTARVVAPARVRVSGLKRRVRVAALPAWHNSRLARLLAPLPGLQPAPSVLVTGLANIGAVFHPAPVVFNATRIEAGEPFEFYREGITPTVAATLERIDAERLAIARAWGVAVEGAARWLERVYGLPPGARSDRWAAGPGMLATLLRRNPAYRGVRAPATLHHRYLEEDVPTGLVPLVELGRLVGVQAPVMQAVARLAGQLLQRDLFEEGRTLRALGLAEASPRLLREVLLTGQWPDAFAGREAPRVEVAAGLLATEPAGAL